MANNGTSTRMTVRTAAPVMTWSVIRRRKATGCTVRRVGALAVSGIGPRGLAAGNGPDQQTCKGVDDDRNQEQSQANLDQSRAVDTSDGLAEFIGQHAGHGIARRKEGFHNLGIV